MIRVFCAVLASFLTVAPRVAAEPPVRKVLLVGMDGIRPDAIESSQAKALKALIAEGAFSDKCDVLGDRETKADTASGSGWSTILTGKLADKHNVFGNDFRENKLSDCPSILHRLKDATPARKAVGLVTWVPMHEFILTEKTGSKLLLDGDKKGYREGDTKVGDEAVKLLQEEEPDFLFIYFGHVDSAGHGYGFHPKSPKYTNAIEEADGHLERVIAAMRKRKNYENEDWLVLVCTDHGGQGKGHGGGAKIPEIRTGFLIASGKSVTKGKIAGPVSNADVVPTALNHLGVKIDPEWKLDGKAITFKK